MGKDAAIIRNELRVRLGQIARELGREVYPDGLSPDTKFSGAGNRRRCAGR